MSNKKNVKRGNKTARKPVVVRPRTQRRVVRARPRYVAPQTGFISMLPSPSITSRDGISTVSNVELLSPVCNYNSTVTNSGFAQVLFEPNVGQPSWLTKMMTMYDFYRVNSVEFIYAATAPATSSGQVIFAYDPDAGDSTLLTLPWNNDYAEAIRIMTSQRIRSITAIFNDMHLKVPVDGRWRRVAHELVGDDTGQTGEISRQLNFLGTFAAGFSLPANAGQVGTVVIKYNVSFSRPENITSTTQSLSALQQMYVPPRTVTVPWSHAQYSVTDQNVKVVEVDSDTALECGVPPAATTPANNVVYRFFRFMSDFVGTIDYQVGFSGYASNLPTVIYSGSQVWGAIKKDAADWATSSATHLVKQLVGRFLRNTIIRFAYQVPSLTNTYHTIQRLESTDDTFRDWSEVERSMSRDMFVTDFSTQGDVGFDVTKVPSQDGRHQNVFYNDNGTWKFKYPTVYRVEAYFDGAGGDTFDDTNADMVCSNISEGVDGNYAYTTSVDAGDAWGMHFDSQPTGSHQMHIKFMVNPGHVTSKRMLYDPLVGGYVDGMYLTN